jgi:hypothetical protein
LAAPPDDFFDFERLRRNFEPAAGPAPRPVHRALEAVRPKGDPLVEAAEALRALEEEVALRLPGRAATLAPFLATLRERFEALPGPGRTPRAGAEAGAEEGDPFARFDQALDPLEDLLEVFAFVPERKR